MLEHVMKQNMITNRRITSAHIIIFACIGVLIGITFSLVELKVFLSIVGALTLLACTVCKPELGILAIVILTSSIIFEESLPLIPIGIGSLHISDILLIVLFGLMLVNYFSGKNELFVKTPLNTPLAMFYIMSIIAAYISIKVYGIEFSTVIRTLRSVSYYLIFYLTINHIRETKQLLFLTKGLLAIGIMVAIAMLAQAIIGGSTQLMPGRIENSATFEEQYEALRILPPGQTLLYLLFITAVSTSVIRREKSIFSFGNLCMILIFGIGVILTYNRTYWIAILLALSILVFLIPRNSVKRLLVLFSIFLSIIVIAILGIGNTRGKMGETVQAVSERFTSVFTGKKLTTSSSLDDRYSENRYAMIQIKDHPIFGSGLANTYRPNLYGPKDELTNYIHNCYLWILMNMGIIGFVFFMWFYFSFIIRGIRKCRSIHDKELRAIMTGCTLGGIGILPMALLNPIFMQWYSIVVLAIVIGIVEVIIKIDRKQQVVT